jgi:CheY-like chemotaxis protein
MLRLLLTMSGHDVDEAADGPTAISKVGEARPDIALIDLGLPGLDGYEVAQRIRATESGQPVTLIAISGYGQREDRQRAIAAGFDAHLTKPVDPERLIELIEQTGDPNRSLLAELPPQPP